jgi:hypothetical protein
MLIEKLGKKLAGTKKTAAERGSLNLELALIILLFVLMSYFAVTFMGFTLGNTFGIAANMIGGGQPPASAMVKVAGVIPTPGDSHVSLVWLPVRGASSYRVTVSTSRDMQENPTAQDNVPQNSYDVLNLTNDTVYYFTVEAKSSDGNYGSPSDPVSAVPSALTPQAPTTPDLSGNAVDSGVDLAWTRPIGTVTDYRITCSTTEDMLSPIANGVTTTSVDQEFTSYSGLTNGTTYYFTVEAHNTVGYSAPSNVVPVTPGNYVNPGKITDLTGTPGSGSIELRWSSPLQGSSPIAGYDVRRSEDGGNTWNDLTPGGIGEPFPGTFGALEGYLDSTAVNDVTYQYIVIAYDGSTPTLWGEWSDPITAMAHAPMLPGKITVFSAVGQDGSALLTWDTPLLGDNPPIGYVIERRALGSATFVPTPMPLGGAAVSYTDPGLVNGTTYQYIIAAYDSSTPDSGWGPWSDIVEATPANQGDTQAPTTPGSVAWSIAPAVNAGRPMISWTPSTDNVGVTGYRIRRSTTGDMLTVGSAPRTLPSTATTYSTGVTIPGAIYYYTVDAYDAAGNHSVTSPVMVIGAPSTPDMFGGAYDSSNNVIIVGGGMSSHPLGINHYDVYRATGSAPGVWGTGNYVGTVNPIANPPYGSMMEVYVDSNISPNTTYYYMVVAYPNREGSGNPDSAIGSSSSVISVTAPAITTVAPSKITNWSTGNPRSGGVDISWTPPLQGTYPIAGYDIRRSDDGGNSYKYLAPAGVGGTGYTDSTTTDGQSYKYIIATYDDHGNWSVWSDALDAAPYTLVAPEEMVWVWTNPTADGVVLTWNPPIQGSSPIVRYEIERARVSNDVPDGYQYVTADPITGTSYTDADAQEAARLGNGGTLDLRYYYKLRAVNADGLAGPWSHIFSAQNIGPTPPTSVVANPSATSVNISWSPSIQGTRRIAGYAIMDLGNNTYTFVGPDATSIVVPGLTSNTQYNYSVFAYDDASVNGNMTFGGIKANISYPNPTVTFTTTNPTPPDTLAPASAVLSANPGDGTVALSWNQPYDNVGITGYVVKRSTASNMTGAVATHGGRWTGTTFNDTGLVDGTLYYYTVDAYDAAGNHSTSNIAAARPVSTKVTGLSVTVQSPALALNWSSLSGADSYRVMRSTNNNMNGAAQIGSLVAGTGYSDSSVTAGTTYYYTVAAHFPGGTYGIASDVASGKVPTIIAPAADTAPPTSVIANASYDYSSGTAVALGWSAATDDVGVAGYRIKRATNSAMSANLVTLDSPGTGLSYTDSSVVSGTTYYYQVAAYDAAGNLAAYSPAVSPVRDATAPTVSSNIGSTYYKTAPDPVFTVTDNSGGSGLSADSGDYTAKHNGTTDSSLVISGGTGTFPRSRTVTPSGWPNGQDKYVATFVAHDAAGNASATYSKTYYVDSTAPSSSDNVGSSITAGGYGDDVYVKISASDAVSGVDHINYKLNGGSTIHTVNSSVTGSIAFSSNLRSSVSHSITYRAVDNAGNTESWMTANFTVKPHPDNTDPHTTFTPPNAGAFFPTPILDATDSGWGVKSTHFQVDGGSWYSGEAASKAQLKPSAFTTLHTIKYYSIDYAGNVETIHTSSYVL